MIRDDADVIRLWRYGPGYRLCDFSHGDVKTMLLPRLRYYAVRQDDVLVGVACFGEDARIFGGPYDGPALDLGCAMAPELCGQGRGAEFFAAICAFAADSFDPPELRLTVAVSNHRAIRVFERAGFKTLGRFAGMMRGGIHSFLLMSRRGESANTDAAPR
jgi:RimJ/RimL family protein N-acetyltransferase